MQFHRSNEYWHILHKKRNRSVVESRQRVLSPEFVHHLHYQSSANMSVRIQLLCKTHEHKCTNTQIHDTADKWFMSIKGLLVNGLLLTNYYTELKIRADTTLDRYMKYRNSDITVAEEKTQRQFSRGITYNTTHNRIRNG